MSVAMDGSTLSNLDPTLAQDLKLAAVKNSMRVQGSHIMALKQVSRVPEYAREYVPGDPINLVDWKAFARTDQVLVREHRDESSAKVRIVLDIHDTMFWPDPAPDSFPQKISIATRVAMFLAHAHLRMGDTVKIWLIDSSKDEAPTREWGPRSPSDVVSMHRVIEAGGFSIDALQSDFVDKLYRGDRTDVVWWVGDGLGGGVAFDHLDMGRRRGLIHVLSSRELSTDWIEEDVTYFDNSFVKKEYRGQAIGELYVDQIRDWRASVEKKITDLNGGYFLATDTTKIGALFLFLEDYGKRNDFG